MVFNINCVGFVKFFRNYDIEFQDVKYIGDSIEYVVYYYMNVGLSEDDMIFFENFFEEKRKKIFCKVCVFFGCNSESMIFRVIINCFCYQIDWCFVFFFVVLYMMVYFDCVNIGNVKIEGMNEELGFFDI